MTLVSKTTVKQPDSAKGGVDFDLIYPVGSIYMSATMSTAAQVEAAFGGTWQAWGQGRVPVGVDATQTEFNTVSKTGGIKETGHAVYDPPINSYNAQNANSAYVDYTNARINAYLQEHGSSAMRRDVIVASVGGDIFGDAGLRNPTEAAFKYYTSTNLQPYITCYMYKRTA